MGPAHFHAYRWQGERRVFDQENDRRPGPGPEPSLGFLANTCTPLRISDWLLRPATAITRTCGSVEEAVAWYRHELTRAAPALGSPAERAAVPALVRSAKEQLARGADVHGGWYLRGTGFHTLDLVCCSPHPTRPELPCPLTARPVLDR